MAMTADGKIATANRRISRFGSRRDLAHLYALRATADAILCGAGTINAEDASLGSGPRRFRQLRLARGLPEYPLRVVVSGRGRVRTQARLFRTESSPVLVITSREIPRRRLDRLRKVATRVRRFGSTRVDLRAALRWLHREWGVRRLLCEGGAELNDALLRARLVDAIHLTVCPFIVGGRHAPTFVEGAGSPSLGGAILCRLKSRRRVGDELYLVYETGR